MIKITHNRFKKKCRHYKHYTTNLRVQICEILYHDSENEWRRTFLLWFSKPNIECWKATVSWLTNVMAGYLPWKWKTWIAEFYNILDHTTNNNNYPFWSSKLPVEVKVTSIGARKLLFLLLSVFQPLPYVFNKLHNVDTKYSTSLSSLKWFYTVHHLK